LGVEKIHSEFTQSRFDEGHKAEADIRPHIEAMIGEELFPVVGVLPAISAERPALLASFDGINLVGNVLFEHKLWNEKLAETVKRVAQGRDELPMHHVWQLEHQLLVSGAEVAYFVTSNGTPDKCAVCEYCPQPGLAEALLAGWKQFEADMAAYQPPTAAPVVAGRSPELLPKLEIAVTGNVQSTNIQAFKAHAVAVIEDINTNLQTDQDFADAKKASKWCADVEEQIKAAKAQALAQTASIEALFSTLDGIYAHVRDKRLMLEKLVKQEEENRRYEIKHKAELDFAEFVSALYAPFMAENISISRLITAPELGAAMKGKRTLATLQNAVDTALATAKIQARQAAQAATVALKAFHEAAFGNEHLFSEADIQSYISQPPDSVRALVSVRIQSAKNIAQKLAQALAAKQPVAALELPLYDAQEAPKSEFEFALDRAVSGVDMALSFMKLQQRTPLARRQLLSEFEEKLAAEISTLVEAYYNGKPSMTVAEEYEETAMRG
jgi:predicted phage-related endonuclease